jgi:hypothetical protein
LGSAWRFQIPDDLLFRASNNLLEFLAAIITPWIDIIYGRLNPGDCALSMTDSTTAEGWMRKSNFSEASVDPIQARVRADAARKYADIFMNADVKGYSQWFAGKGNNVADALSREWHRTNDELTFLLHHHFPNQMPAHFEISPLPKEISSWLTSLLRQLPVSEQLREEHMTAKLEHGDDGQPTASPSDAETPTWTPSLATSESSCSGHLQWLSGKEDSRTTAMKHWLKGQSAVPFHMWYRPSGQQDGKIPRRTKTTSLASFYRDNSEPSKTTIPNSNNKRPSPSSPSMN